MRRWLGIAAILSAGCDDTVFGGKEVEYPPTWLGVQVFFFDHCMSCHPSVEPSIDLPDDIRRDVCDGTGTWVVPGDPEASMLWRIVSGETLDGDPAIMPFGRGLLPSYQTAFLREWIDAGAPVEGCP